MVFCFCFCLSLAGQQHKSMLTKLPSAPPKFLHASSSSSCHFITLSNFHFTANSLWVFGVVFIVLYYALLISFACALHAVARVAFSLVFCFIFFLNFFREIFLIFFYFWYSSFAFLLLVLAFLLFLF